MRLLFTLISLGAAGYGLWWVAATKPELKSKVEEILHTGSFHYPGNSLYCQSNHGDASQETAQRQSA